MTNMFSCHDEYFFTDRGQHILLYIKIFNLVVVTMDPDSTLQADMHTATHRHTHIDTQRQSWRNTEPHRDIQKHTQRQTHIETNRDTERHTHTHRDTHRQTRIHIATH